MELHELMSHTLSSMVIGHYFFDLWLGIIGMPIPE